MWNAISVVQDLNSCRRVHSLRRQPLHHGHLLKVKVRLTHGVYKEIRRTCASTKWKIHWNLCLECLDGCFEENERFIHDTFLASVSICFEHISYLEKKIIVSFIVHFFLGKYSFSLDTFWIHFLFWRKLTFHSWYISGLINIGYPVCEA